MLFIKNGMHMVAIKEGSILNVKPNPKFVRDGVGYGAIMLNETPIGIYPLDQTGLYTEDVYSVFRNICKQINNGDRATTIPMSYQFNTVQEYEEFNKLLKEYNNDELMDIYYNGIKRLQRVES